MAPPPLAELTARAQTLTSAGDLVGARQVLAGALGPADVDPRHADADLALAAALHARILIALGDPHGARMWAGFAHAAEERLHGPRHERTVAAAATHAAVLQRVGHFGRAAQVYQHLVGNLAALDGTDSPRVLAAEADLATAEHAAGHCTSARARLTDAWVRHRHFHGDAAPAGIKMLARLGAMERECAQEAESREHLALAQELCARYLPADHPLVRQVAALALAPASGRHVCGRVAQSTGPAAPPASAAPTAPAAVPHPRRPPVQDAADTGFPPDRLDQGQGRGQGYRPTEPGPPRNGRLADSGSLRNGRLAQSGPPADSRFHDPESMPDHRFNDPGSLPDGRSTDPGAALDNRPTEPNGRVYQQPLYLADVHPAPGDLTGRHARADTLPPLPGRGPSDYGSDGRLQPIGTAAAGTLATPPNSERLLPVRLEPPPAPSRQPFLLAAVLVAGIAVAAVVVALTLRGGTNVAGPAPTAATAGTAATTSTAAPSVPAANGTPSVAGDSGAPTGVTLRDNRDSVALTWRYPRNAEGPVLVSGGRQGQQLKVFQQLAAGTADYMVYGLNEAVNYCFTVAVAYSTDRIAASAPVCTRR
jgi:hypothetical protein